MPDVTFKVGADISGLKKSIADARGEIARGLSSFTGLGGVASAAGIGAALGKAVSNYVDRAKDIAKLAQIANASVESASKLSATAEQFGVSSDKLADAMRNVAQSGSKNPELFKAIGVSLEDANGKARPTIDVFNDVRDTISGGSQDFRTTAAAAQILGRSVEDLYPFLMASKKQVEQVTAAAQDMGLVMSKDDVTAALAYAGSLSVAQAQGEALSRSIAGTLIPMLANLTEAAFSAGDMLDQLINKGASASHTEDNPLRDVPIIGGISNLIQNTGNIVAGRGTDRLKEINDAVNAKAKIRADFAKLATNNLLSGGGGGFSFPELGGGKGRDTAADAMRDQIDAIKSTSDAKEQATRDALEAYQRERTAAIDTARKVADAWDGERHRRIDALRAEEEAGQKAIRTQIEGIRNAIAARERQRAHAMQAIRDQIAAEQAAFDAREAGRQAERDALDAQLKAIDAADAAKSAASDLEKAQNDVAVAKAGEPERVRSESLDEFTQRHDAWVKDVADAEQRLRELQERQAKDAARAAIEAQIEELNNATDADRKEVDSKKSAHDDQIALIEAEAQADRERTDDAIALLQEQADFAKEKYDERIALLEAEAELKKTEDDARIQAMQNELASHTQTVNDEIENLRRQTAATVAELEAQLQMHQRNAAAISAAYPNIQRTITYSVVGGGGGTSSGGGGGSSDTFIAAASGFDGIVGPGAGGPRLILAGEGSSAEEVHVGPVGRGARGGGREELHIYIDGREVQATVSRRSYSELRLGGGKG